MTKKVYVVNVQFFSDGSYSYYYVFDDKKLAELLLDFYDIYDWDDLEYHGELNWFSDLSSLTKYLKENNMEIEESFGIIGY